MQAATPSEIAELTEAEARALFRRYRFMENGGDPYCNRDDCGSVAVWSYKDGNLFKCKGCLRQFTLTTNTPFSYHKLPFKLILQILAQFALAYQGRSAREILRDLRKIKNYKTIFVWLHKARLALKKHEQLLELSGEIEIDGKELGGYIRPKNARLLKTDYWKVPYRAADRKLWLTTARARTGATRAWVCREEEDAVESFKRSAPQGGVVFADGGNWAAIRDAQFELRQVSHRQFFYTEDACTNHTESANNVVATMERIFRHISGNYLDSYAAQMAWRMSCVTKTVDDIFADLMKAMMNGGRSPMTGYFLPKAKGGRKRQCEIVNPDGSVGFWSPPTPQERKRARDAARKAGGRRPIPLLRDARSAARWKDDFTFLSAAAFLSDPKLLPSVPGVYCLFARSGAKLLSSAGYFPDPNVPSWVVDSRTHLYTGECIGLRKRLREHLSGDIAASTFRGSLLAMIWQSGEQDGDANPFVDRQDTEAALSEWLADEIVIGFKPCGYTRQHQNAVLARTASPLNITDREKTPFARLLEGFRAEFKNQVESFWAPPPPKSRRNYRR